MSIDSDSFNSQSFIKGRLARPAQSAINLSFHNIFLVYSFYRLGIGIILLSLFALRFGLGSANPSLFLTTSIIYILSNILLVFASLRYWNPPSDQRLFIAATDLLCLMIFSKASGSYDSGIAALLITSIASGVVVAGKHHALTLSSLGSILLLVNATSDWYYGNANTSSIVSTGWLCITLFAVSITVKYLVNRIQDSDSSAAIEHSRSIQLEQINRTIIERMQTGILVARPTGDVITTNASAKELLGNLIEVDPNDVTSEDANTPLKEFFNSDETQLQITNRQGKSLLLSRLNIVNDLESNILIFVEDLAKINQHAEQLKLSSLGILTASIAHEIRNPLAAVNNAAQLLEGATATAEIDHLKRIILDQSKRCSSIISTVLDLSRRKPAAPEMIELSALLRQLASEFKHCYISANSLELTINADTGQTKQILANLIDNGLQASECNFTSTEKGRSLHQCFLHYYKNEQDCVVIEVYDQGPGVSDEQKKRLFEPFATTKNKGTGLGLYLCRELCQSNQASISYIDDIDKEQPNSICAPKAPWFETLQSKHCFRITFSHLNKKTLLTNNPSNLENH